MGFLGNVSPEWMEEQSRLWREDPRQVSPELRAFFEGFELGSSIAPVSAEEEPPAGDLKSSGVQSLIYRYRDIGHLLACTDPLSPCAIDHPLLALSHFGLVDADLDRSFHTRRFMKSPATLREVLTVMRETYCRSIGVEFMHIQAPTERQWLIDRMEPVRNRPDVPEREQLVILEQLLSASLFEEFLHRKFIGQTRFSLEGGETLIPVLHALIARAGTLGVSDLILGMPHRGRLTVLSRVLGMPAEEVFASFRDNIRDGVVGDGDVKYHLGFSGDATIDGATIHLTLAANPSHLEAIDPVVVGKARARQDRYGDGSVGKVLPVLIHGDAAFAGQGVVAETFNLSQLEGYGTGGTVHIVLNNQIGFTTRPKDARSSCYATDVAKMVMAPVFHVHGEDPEAAVHAARLALEYRHAFRRDVVLEIICYRRYGHNEGDEPYFTQPVMYDMIRNRPRVADRYMEQLRERGGTPDQAGISSRIGGELEAAFARESSVTSASFGGTWRGIRRGYERVVVDTGVAAERLKELSFLTTALPDGFSPHGKVQSLMEKRREAVRKGEGIDWGNAESLAFASLAGEGVRVRLSGQDAARGTFSQRHSIVYDLQTERRHNFPDQAAADGGSVRAYDSMLSEFAVVGFEYGYSLESPETLVLWEAQYGDFANGAQVIIDQFISSGETKWDRLSGLVMLLPHGYEGQGAEHSSARIERFLQLCAGNNTILANPTTPAQYFHLLRRQVRQPFRKPLIIFTPKSLLRHPRCVSSLDEYTGGAFREVFVTAENREATRAVLICSGKLYFELLERREREDLRGVALVRIEQLYPLHYDLLGETLSQFSNASFTWVQEEPRNMGAWQWIRHQLAEILGKEPRYVGRPEDAAPAVGSHRMHKEEQERVLTEAFAL